MEDFGDVILVVFVTIGILVIIRHLVLWYWKINRVVELLESIDQKLDVRINQGDIQLGTRREENITTNTP